MSTTCDNPDCTDPMHQPDAAYRFAALESENAYLKRLVDELKGEVRGWFDIQVGDDSIKIGDQVIAEAERRAKEQQT